MAVADRGKNGISQWRLRIQAKRLHMHARVGTRQVISASPILASANVLASISGEDPRRAQMSQEDA